MIESRTDRDTPWDPLGTLARTLWLCGGQWAGRTTVARTLADRYGLVAYLVAEHWASYLPERAERGRPR